MVWLLTSTAVISTTVLTVAKMLRTCCVCGVMYHELVCVTSPLASAVCSYLTLRNSSKDNKRSLKTLDSALCVIALDDDTEQVLPTTLYIVATYM
jgi:hypothetical protein